MSEKSFNSYKHYIKPQVENENKGLTLNPLKLIARMLAIRENHFIKSESSDSKPKLEDFILPALVNLIITLRSELFISIYCSLKIFKT